MYVELKQFYYARYKHGGTVSDYNSREPSGTLVLRGFRAERA